MTTRLAYTVPEAAEQLGVSDDTLRREIREGKLRARRIRGCIRVLAGEIERYLGAADVVQSDAEKGRQQRRGRGTVTRLIDLGIRGAAR